MKWHFDNWSCLHWDEIKAGNVDKTKAYVEHAEGEDCTDKLTIYSDSKTQLTIEAARDMWGTWITFQIGDKGFTVAQEDGTMSFIDALIAGLTRLKSITDIETKPPTIS